MDIDEMLANIDAKLAELDEMGKEEVSNVPAVDNSIKSSSMNEDELVDLLNNMLKNRDFSRISELVPYEDRFALFMKTHSIKLSNDYVYSMVVDSIFTMEEAEALFSQVTDESKKKILFEMLSDESKILYVDEIDIDTFAIPSFLDSVKDEEARFNFAVKFMEASKIWDFSLKNLLEKFSNEYKIRLFYRMFDYLEKKGNPISGFDAPDYIEQFDGDNRAIVFKYIVDNSKKVLSYMYLHKCLSKLPSETRKEALFYVVDKNIEEYTKYFGDLYEILSVIPEEQYYETLTELLDRDIIKTYTISEMFKNYPVEKCEEIIDFTLDYCKKNNKKILKDYCVSTLLNLVPRDIGVRIYQKYGINEEYFGNLGVARNTAKVEDKYFYLDYLVGAIKINDFDKAFNLLDQTLFEIESVPAEYEEYPHLIDMYVKKYNVDRIHLVEFIKRFSYLSLRFLNSKSVQSVINLPDEEFVKFMNIFSHDTMLDNNIINSICNSFLQREFRLEKNDDYTIFTQFELLIAGKEEDGQIKIAELLVKVSQVVDIDTYLNKKGISFDQFVYDLTNSDKDSIDMLHDMTQEYIMKQRETYVKGKLDTVFDEIGVVKKVEKSAYKKKLIEISSGFDIRYLLQSIPVEHLTEEEKEVVKNNDLLERLYKFKKERTPFEDASEKRYLKVFESLLNKAYEYKYDAKKFEGIEGLPYSYFPIEPTNEWLLGIIVECNIDQTVDRVLGDKQVYSELIAFIDKYKMLGWDKAFNCFNERAEVDFTEGTMASIISNFYTISAIAKEKDANLTQFLDYANCFDSMSKTYSYLLCKDNYRAIAANEGKNKAGMSKAERLGRVPKLINGMYGRQEITTPPIDKDYETGTGKKLNVVLGNSTNMINLSYGERTNSCLRIGGAFNNLFEFCIQDKNGFHVRFTDPVTGKFISRVSGIRNGNTIFFNELRDSENPNYSNEEIIEVLNALSSELIEATKGEECPIDNVVITYDYAMRNYEKVAVPTELANYPNAFYGLRFNIAFDGKFVVLKTTSPDGSLVPYKFGADLAQTYETQRDKVVTIADKDMAYDKVTQLHLIDSVLKGYEVDELTIPENTDINLCIAGEDWCVYADSQGNVHQFVVEMSKQKDRALVEMKAALEKLKEILNVKQQGKAVGGV